MARLASLITAVAGAAIAFTTGWILGYVLAPQDEPARVVINNPAISIDPVALRKQLEHTHPASGLQTGAESPPAWTDDLRRRGEQV